LGGQFLDRICYKERQSALSITQLVLLRWIRYSTRLSILVYLVSFRTTGAKAHLVGYFHSQFWECKYRGVGLLPLIIPPIRILLVVSTERRPLIGKETTD